MNAYPSLQNGSYIAKDFRFSTGDVFPELKIHYTKLGDPKNPAALVLHGTTGSGIGMVNPDFAGELFGAGQPLDAAKYFIILPDAIGTGNSSKPSDGLRAKFPRYNYDDMVEAQYRLVSEHFGLKRLRLLIGNSMGGMQTWMWAQKYPIMDIAVPMASLPTEISSRNWMMRRLITESIRARADRILDSRLAAKYTGDANDHLYQWESSGDYNPSSGLEKITATLLAINSADDERNPPELGILEREIKRVRNGSFYLIPASPDTAGHGTTGMARFWKAELAKVLAATPKTN